MVINGVGHHDTTTDQPTTVLDVVVVGVGVVILPIVTLRVLVGLVVNPLTCRIPLRFVPKLLVV
jgi:hypothetical protein